MKPLSKNTITVLLMMSSIALLLLLQAFWLRSAYRDAAGDFQKETNALFRSVVVAMHDTLIQRSIEPVNGNFPQKAGAARRIFVSDTIGAFPSDSLVTVKERVLRFEIIPGAGTESTGRNYLRPLASHLHNDSVPKTFILRLGADSLSKDSIEAQFRKALATAGIHARFTVLTGRNEGKKPRLSRVERGTVTSDVVRLSPMNRFSVSFHEIDGLLLREIMPQILFSVFLTLLIAGAFYAMYRNLVAQQQLMSIKNDLISNITHELKTPVATVSVALEALRNFNVLNDRERTAEYLDIAQNELGRLSLMTDKILKTAVFEDKGLEMKFQVLNLDALVREVLSSMRLLFEKRKMAVSYDRSGNDFTIEGSAQHLTNVLYNLVDNAVKYSFDSSPINIDLKATPETVALSVRDGGIGIAREHHARIFEKFFRVPSGDVHNTPGYGLGLSYVASVVKNHGGEITVDSEPGKGSCFTVTLPRKNENQDTLRGG